jgi:hypothetical protein
MLLRDLSLEGVEVRRLALVVSVEEEANDLGTDANGRFGLRAGGDHRNGGGKVDEKVEGERGKREKAAV